MGFLLSFYIDLSITQTRRCLTPSSGIITAPEFFLETFHSTFRGDFRVNNQKDEWVFVDVQMLVYCSILCLASYFWAYSLITPSRGIFIALL